MRRREFISLLGSTAIAWPSYSRAVSAGKVWRVGIIITSAATERSAKGLERELVDLGYVDGKNIVLIEKRSDPNIGAVESAILSLIPAIDLLVVGGTVGGVAAKKVVTSLPVVFVAVGAPIEIGLVESLSHPGGNMTGISFEAAAETYGKRLQILKEILPKVSRVAVLQAQEDENGNFATASLERAAPDLGVNLSRISVGSSGELPSAFDEMERRRCEAVIVIAGVLTYGSGQQIADLALAHHLPSCHAFREAVAVGGLVSLGPNLVATWRQAAGYVDKIIRGTEPKDLPVQQPTQYELAINLKTAKVLNIEMPAALIARADEVIE
jgi:putative tryptophan/tyrosine transport system substrate-binding protein